MPPRTDDFLSKILRHGKDTRQQVGQQIGDFFRGPEPEQPVEPTVGPDIPDQRRFFENLIRQMTEEDRRSGESGAPYPDEGLSPEEILMQQALQQGDAGPEPDMGFSNPEVMRQILGDLPPEALGSPAMPPGEAAGRLPLRLPTGR